MKCFSFFKAEKLCNIRRLLSIKKCPHFAKLARKGHFFVVILRGPLFQLFDNKATKSSNKYRASCGPGDASGWY
jgi:hypothetical protein